MNKLTWLLILLPSLLFSQNSSRTFGVIVMSEKNKIESFINSIAAGRNRDVSYKQLGHLTSTYLITSSNDADIYKACQNDKDVIAFEYNYELKPRNKPNDTKINDQYYLSIIKAFETWDVTTGGKDYKGKDIIIGVVDDGYLLTHEDLKDNFYINPDELPNDNKDNDGNGYKDDYIGWNTRTGTGTHDEKSHGTNILGVLGAKGNNSTGISGINWNIKILPVTTGTFVSNVIEAYEYLLAERKQYNQSGGTKGSNILVTSYSGGLANAFASDHPIWCSIYDKLGAEGVLNVGATTNEDVNVEEVGDMPSTCTSPYLLIVNSTNKLDQKDASTGVGVVSVDMSAPGERILTTDLISKGLYKTESGTSLSTPMVAGAAALLHSVKCEAFNTLVVDDPKAAALVIKDVLMTTSDKISSLQGKTVSGGRLNLSAALQKILIDFCSKELSPKGDLKINAVSWTENGLSLDYISPDSQELILKIFDYAGKEVFQTVVTPPVFGKKSFNIQPDIYLPGMIYFAALISGNNIASRGFNTKDPTK